MIAFRQRLDREADAQALFAALADEGRAPGCVLLQSSDQIPRYGERSIGAVGASLRLEGRGDRYRLDVLDERGRILLPFLLEGFGAISTVEASSDQGFFGRLEPDLSCVDGRQRPFRRSHADLMRVMIACAEGESDHPLMSHGLFGLFGYTLIHQYERLPRHPRDVLKDPDYCLFLATRLFLVDHAAGVTHLVSSVPVAEGCDLAGLLLEGDDESRRFLRMAERLAPRCAARWSLGELTSDTDERAFRAAVGRIKEDIVAGRVFQAVFGRMISGSFEGNPLDVYCALSRSNPSPYMFFVNDGAGEDERFEAPGNIAEQAGNGSGQAAGDWAREKVHALSAVLMGASPEMAVRVHRMEGGRLALQIRPIAGTKPRGKNEGRIDPLLDAKYEMALKIDAKELAEHTMLVDLARNDVAGLCEPGTTLVNAPLIVEKYSHVQHLVSGVSGILRAEMDALHAYLGTMNMGTVTGAPKLEAMRMIHELEASCRGYFAGGVGYLAPDGQMDTALVIRAIRFKQGRAHVRTAAGIVADSVPESEWQETENKARACLSALAGVST